MKIRAGLAWKAMFVVDKTRETGLEHLSDKRILVNLLSMGWRGQVTSEGCTKPVSVLDKLREIGGTTYWEVKLSESDEAFRLLRAMMAPTSQAMGLDQPVTLINGDEEWRGGALREVCPLAPLNLYAPGAAN